MNLNELLNDIQVDKQIDPDSLDIAWVEQADLYYKYSNALNEALERKNDQKTVVEKEKEKLEKVKAELDLDIRRDPDSYNIAKVTESVVSSAMLLDSNYQKQLDVLFLEKEKLNSIQNEVNQLYSCVATMEQRKTALEQLVRLLNQQYFATPEEPRDLPNEYHKKVEQNRKGAKEKVKKRRREK